MCFHTVQVISSLINLQYTQIRLLTFPAQVSTQEWKWCRIVSYLINVHLSPTLYCWSSQMYKKLLNHRKYTLFRKLNALIKNYYFLSLWEVGDLRLAQHGLHLVRMINSLMRKHWVLFSSRVFEEQIIPASKK